MRQDPLTHPAEAHAVLANKVEELRQLGYEELRRRRGEPALSLFGGRLQIGGPRPVEDMRRGPSGIEYQLHTEVFPDGGPGDDVLRVWVDLYEECMAYRMLRGEFLIAPGNVFIGE